MKEKKRSKTKVMVVRYYITEYKKNGNLRAWVHRNFKLGCWRYLTQEHIDFNSIVGFLFRGLTAILEYESVTLVC